MLSNKQLVLSKTAEESSELAKECLKGQLYGTASAYNGVLNEELIREEALDTLVCIRRLELAGVIRYISDADVSAHYQSKLDKIKRRTAMAIEANQLEPAAYGLIPERV